MTIRIDWFGDLSMENMLCSIAAVLVSFVVITILALVVFVFLIGITVSSVQFLRQLRHINLVISATEGEEQQRWRRERRRLWLSLLPFCCEKEET